MNDDLGYFNLINKRAPLPVHYFNPDMTEPQWKENISIISNNLFLCLPQHRRLLIEYHCLALCYYQYYLYASLMEITTSELVYFRLSIHCAVGQWETWPKACDLSVFNTLSLHCTLFQCWNMLFILWLYICGYLISLFYAHVWK